MKRLTVIVALTLLPVAAAAQSTGVLATKRPITWGMIFALLFLMLGPIKLLGPFAAATKDCDRVFRFRLATRAFLFSAAAVTIAAALGEQMLDNFAIPVLVLQIAAGLILFLVALQAVMHQYDVTHPPDRTEPPTLALAFSPSHFRPSLLHTGSQRLPSSRPSLPQPKSGSCWPGLFISFYSWIGSLCSAHTSLSAGSARCCCSLALSSGSTKWHSAYSSCWAVSQV